MFGLKCHSSMLATTIEASTRSGNPTSNPALTGRFLDGYTEISISAKSRNSPFPSGKWKVLVVNAIDGIVRPAEVHEGVTYVQVPLNTTVEKVKAKAGVPPNSTGGEEVGLLTIRLWDGEESSQVVLICDREVAKAA
jgi:hypothetical protein